MPTSCLVSTKESHSRVARSCLSLCAWATMVMPVALLPVTILANHPSGDTRPRARGLSSKEPNRLEALERAQNKRIKEHLAWT